MTSYRRACVCVTVYTRHTHTHTNWNTHAHHRTRVRHTLTPLGSFDFFTADFFPLTTRIPHFSPHFFHRFLLHPLPFHLLFFHPLSPFSFLFFSSRDVYQRPTFVFFFFFLFQFQDSFRIVRQLLRMWYLIYPGIILSVSKNWQIKGNLLNTGNVINNHRSRKRVEQSIDLRVAFRILFIAASFFLQEDNFLVNISRTPIFAVYHFLLPHWFPTTSPLFPRLPMCSTVVYSFLSNFTDT